MSAQQKRRWLSQRTSRPHLQPSLAMLRAASFHPMRQSTLLSPLTAETCYSSYRATVSGVTKSNHSCTHAIPPTAPTTSYSSTTSPELATGHSSGGSTITVKATATATVTIPWNSGALSGRFFTQLQVPLRLRSLPSLAAQVRIPHSAREECLASLWA